MKKQQIKIDLKELSPVRNGRDFIFILFNEYCLDARFSDKANILVVNTYGESDVDKLKLALTKYGAEDKYVNSINESNNSEIKLNDTNMLKRFVNESASPKGDFVSAFVEVANAQDLVDISDSEYLFGDEYHYIEDIISAIEEISGMSFDSEQDFYDMFSENIDAIDEKNGEKVNALVDNIMDYLDGGNSGEKEAEYDIDAKCLKVAQDAFDSGEISNENEFDRKIDKLVERVSGKHISDMEDSEYNKISAKLTKAWDEIDRTSADNIDIEDDDEDYQDHRNRKNTQAPVYRKIDRGGTFDESKEYAKISNIIAEAKEEGRKEALASMENNDNEPVNEAKKEVPIKVKRDDLRIAKSEFSDKVKELKEIAKIKGLAELTKSGETFDPKALTDAYNDFFRGPGKSLKDKKKDVTAIIHELKRLNKTILVLATAIAEATGKSDAKKINESVTSYFSRLRKEFKDSLNESEDEDKSDSSDDGDDNDDSKKSEDSSDNKEEKKEDNGGKDNDNSDEDEEEIDIPAIVITVKKEAADKSKKDMIDSGVEEDDIEIMEPEDENEEDVEIKVDTNSIIALRDYLATKGIDLEDKLGIEIQSDEDDDEDDVDKKDDKGEKEDVDKKDDSDSENGSDNDELDDDFFASLGNIGNDDSDN